MDSDAIENIVINIDAFYWMDMGLAYTICQYNIHTFLSTCLDFHVNSEMRWTWIEGGPTNEMGSLDRVQ